MPQKIETVKMKQMTNEKDQAFIKRLHVSSGEGAHNETWCRVLIVRAILYKIRSKELKALGLSPEQLGIMEILHESKRPVTPSLICRSFIREPNSISAMLRRMEKKGLVKLFKDLRCKNHIRIELTEKGEELRQEGGKLGIRINSIFNQLSNEEIKTLHTLLDKVWDKSLDQLNEIT